MKVVVLSTDLIDRSKISAALPDATFVGAAASLPAAAEGADLVVVDVSRPGVFDVLDQVVAAAADVVDAVQGAGYRYVTLDLEGFRSGNLNAALGPDQGTPT